MLWRLNILIPSFPVREGSVIVRSWRVVLFSDRLKLNHVGSEVSQQKPQVQQEVRVTVF